MADFPVNPVDVIVALIILVSGLLAFFRGAIRELLGIGAWVGAGIATFFGFAFVRPYARDLITESNAIADAAAGLVIFVVVLVILTIVNQVIAGRIQRSRLGALDRTLGLIFGILRGVVLVCLAYMLFVWAVEPEDRPPWVDEAKTMPYIKRGADAIREVVPDEIEKEGEERTRDTIEKARDAHEIERDVRRLTEPVPRRRPSEPEEPGYEGGERRQLDGLTDGAE